MNNIPTLYKGIQMRSRLEAKWAAFFDLCDWKWQYEPTDFNGWIPDFVIYGAKSIYIEVKPIDTFCQDVADKIDDSGCDGLVLIAGSRNPVFSEDFERLFCIGWCREKWDTDFVWHSAPYGRWNDDRCEGDGTNRIGFCPGGGNTKDIITGSFNSHSIIGNDVTLQGQINSHWAQACNKTQWRGQ